MIRSYNCFMLTRDKFLKFQVPNSKFQIHKDSDVLIIMDIATWNLDFGSNKMCDFIPDSE